MRVLTLQLLAACQLAYASPCKPSSSSSSAALSTTSAESTSVPAISSSTIADETETSTTLFIASTAAASDSATSTILITTSSVEPTTLATSSAEPTTTTTAAAEPTNILTNPGFDSGTTDPWKTLEDRGLLSLSDTGTHSGLFSGYFTGDLPDGSDILGVVHPIEKTLLKPNTEYHYSIWIKTTTAFDCQTRLIACGAGAGYISSSDWAGPYNEWTQFTMTCVWDEYFLNLGPNIQIRAVCETLEFYVDDAVLIEAN
ncbi:hypothetical protein FBULB1_7304 [Fusarium bulbicola]|nr:hypothetical protein FBULB1_7304 [Fusarium bulbicola]